MEFNAWLAEQLGLRLMKASALALYAGVSHATVSKWLSGQYKPKPEQCRGIAKVLRLPEETVLKAAGHLSGEPAATAPPAVHPALEAILRLVPYRAQEQFALGFALMLAPPDEASAAVLAAAPGALDGVAAMARASAAPRRRERPMGELRRVAEGGAGYDAEPVGGAGAGDRPAP